MHTIDSLRQSRQLDSENNGLLYASELGGGDLSGSIPARTFLLSYHIQTTTKTETSTISAYTKLTPTCFSITDFPNC